MACHCTEAHWDIRRSRCLFSVTSTCRCITKGMSVVFCSRSSLVAVKIFCSSRLPLPDETTHLLQSEKMRCAMFSISDLWDLHGLLDFESLLLSCVWIHDFLVEVDLWDGRDHFVKLQLSLPLLDICIGSQMLQDRLAATFLCEVFLLVLRLVSVVVLWFALPAVGYALLLPAVGFSVLFIIAPDLQCSSRCPRTLVALLHSCRHMLVGSGSVCDSHHLLLGCGSVCASWEWLCL